MKEFEAVVFDIDGTLTPEISWTALTRDIGATVDHHISIYQDFMDQKTTYEESKEKLLKLWQETGNANKQFLIRLFEQWPIRDEAVEIINHLKSKECTICLITGSMDLYAEVMARRLGVDFYFANTELVWDGEGNLIDFHYHRDQAKKKLEQFLQFCRINNIDPKKCLIIGDDDNDIELFVLTGKGIAVKSPTSDKLEELAWKKVNNVSDIKEII